jgi:Type II secretion system (T2SS), protein E, N-terminal domain
MPLTLAELLVKIQLIDDRQHDAVLSRARSRSGPHVVQQIVEMGIATESTMARVIGAELSLPRIDFATAQPEPNALHLLDARLCVDRFIVPISLRENGEALLLAMADPTDQETMVLVQQRTGKKVRPGVAGPTEIQRVIRQNYTVTSVDTGKVEDPLDELSSIELGKEPSQIFELVNIMDESASPLSRIAAQLGVGVPQDLPSKHLPKPPVAEAPPQRGPVKLGGEIFATTPGGPIARNDLQPEDLAILDALSQSMEKGALVLRALAELCVEKGLFTREEMRNKRGS